MSEAYYTSLFINGLHKDVNTYVHSFHPSTVIDACDLGCIYECSQRVKASPSLVPDNDSSLLVCLGSSSSTATVKASPNLLKCAPGSSASDHIDSEMLVPVAAANMSARTIKTSPVFIQSNNDSDFAYSQSQQKISKVLLNQSPMQGDDSTHTQCDGPISRTIEAWSKNVNECQAVRYEIPNSNDEDEADNTEAEQSHKNSGVEFITISVPLDYIHGSSTEGFRLTYFKEALSKSEFPVKASRVLFMFPWCEFHCSITQGKLCTN